MDSHCKHNPENVVSDEGDMYAFADGRTLEKGNMVNPETGEMGEYEEVWRDVEIIGTGEGGIKEARMMEGKGKGKARDAAGSSGGDGEGKEGDSEERRRRCIVLTLSDDKRDDVRGMVIRLGQFCQGVLRAGDYFSIERWIWHPSGGWKREVSMGNLWVPCGLLLFAEKVPEVGGEVVFGDFTWKIAEKEEL